MLQSLFQTFRSPYNIVSFHSSRYRQALPYFVIGILVTPVLFLFFKSFLIFLLSQVAIFMLFPAFLWIYLNTDEVTDIKLDIIKVCVIISLYFSYLMMFTWFMILLFKPTLRAEYVFLNLGYLFLLLIVVIIVIITCFYHRYARNIIRRKKI